MYVCTCYHVNVLFQEPCDMYGRTWHNLCSCVYCNVKSPSDCDHQKHQVIVICHVSCHVVMYHVM